jgi:predicted phosphodiesterase
MSNIVFIGDVHLKSKEPYMNSSFQFLDYLEDNHLNDVLVFTGDLFDNTFPHFELLMDRLLKSLIKFPEVYIVSGNHEVFDSRTTKKMGNPLALLDHVSGIRTFLTPEEIEIRGKKFLMLPYLYDVAKMKSEYEALRGTYDFVVSHVAYPETNFGSLDEIDLSKIDCKIFIYGHIHEPKEIFNHYIIGVPVSTRHGEQVWKKQLGIYDLENETFTLKAIPNFVNYEAIKFGEWPKDKNSIISVKDAPSVLSVLDLYKDYHVRRKGITLVDEVENVSYNEQKDFLNFTLTSNFQEFSENSDIRPAVKNKIFELLSKGEV